MKKVKRTKKFSSVQALKMVSGLREKFGNSSSIDYTFWHMIHTDKPTKMFRIYVADVTGEERKTWQQLQDRYFELMES